MGGGVAEMLDNPEELLPLLQMAVSAKLGARKLPRDDPNLRFCYDMLTEVSRRSARPLSNRSVAKRPPPPPRPCGPCLAECCSPSEPSMTRRTEFPCSRSRSAGVARSFAVVVQQLPNKPTRLRDAVCVFYLVLRALDTVEDDMTLSVETKLPILKNFHQHIQDT